MTPAAATFMGDFHRYAWHDVGVQIDVARLEETRNGLHCELSISCTTGHLREGRFNLSAPNTRTQWQRALEERMPDVDWFALLEYVCHHSIKRWREGDPPTDLRKVDLRQRSRWLYRPFVEYAGPTIFFADGGTGKSMFLLAVAVSISTGRPLLGGWVDPPNEGERFRPILYCDYEADEYTHAARLMAICMAADPPIDPLPPVFHQRMTATLSEMAPTVRRRIGELGAKFVVIDSIGPARGGSNGDGSSETIRLFTAARSFGVPWAGVDHVAKGREADRSRPFGSTYTHNLARLTWGLDRDESGDGLTIGLVNYKTNNGQRAPRRAYRVEIATDDDDMPLNIAYHETDYRAVTGFTGRLSQRDQLVAVLRNGALTDEEAVAALAALNVNMTSATIRALVSRHKDYFTRVYDDDRRRPPRIGLLSKAVPNG